MKNSLSIIMFSFLLSIGSCVNLDSDSVNLNFSHTELEYLDSFLVGDTIYFESNLGDLDTIVVVQIEEEKIEGSKKFIQRSPSNHKSVLINHLPIDHWAGTNWTDGTENVRFQSLISLSKFSLQNKIDYSISYRGFTSNPDSTLGMQSTTPLLIESSYHECHIVEHGYPERITNPNDIESIYWTKEYGLSAYKSKKGETWIIRLDS